MGRSSATEVSDICLASLRKAGQDYAGSLLETKPVALDLYKLNDLESSSLSFESCSIRTTINSHSNQN